MNVEGLLMRALARFRASGGSGSGAVEHFPDPGSSKFPKSLGAPGTNEHLAPRATPCGIFSYLRHMGSGVYSRTRSMVAEKGKGGGAWVPMTRVVKGKTVDAGAVSISIAVMHASVAERTPAGAGRSAPNMNPVLPPPARFHWNLLRPDLILIVRRALPRRARVRLLTHAPRHRTCWAPSCSRRLSSSSWPSFSPTSPSTTCRSSSPSWRPRASRKASCGVGVCQSPRVLIEAAQDCGCTRVHVAACCAAPCALLAPRRRRHKHMQRSLARGSCCCLLLTALRALLAQLPSYASV